MSVFDASVCINMLVLESWYSHYYFSAYLSLSGAGAWLSLWQFHSWVKGGSRVPLWPSHTIFTWLFEYVLSIIFSVYGIERKVLWIFLLSPMVQRKQESQDLSFFSKYYYLLLIPCHSSKTSIHTNWVMLQKIKWLHTLDMIFWDSCSFY